MLKWPVAPILKQRLATFVQKGFQKSSQNGPGSKKNNFLDTLILNDPTAFWLDFGLLGMLGGEENP
jgi:hypothetical protein